MERHKGSEVGEFKGKQGWGGGVKALSEQMWQEPLEKVKIEASLLRVISSGTQMHKMYGTYSRQEENRSSSKPKHMNQTITDNVSFIYSRK